MKEKAGVVVAGLAPHAPIIVPEVGGRDATAVQRTQEALDALAGIFREADPDTLVLVSSHAPSFRDAVALRNRERLSGTLADFRAPQVGSVVQVDRELVAGIGREAEEEGFPLVLLDEAGERGYRLAPDLDYGTLVPLYFLERAGFRKPIVSAGIGFLPLADLFRFGRLVHRAATVLGRRVAFLASGDLSHRLTPQAPAGYAPEGREFDRLAVEALRRADRRAFLEMPAALAERAGEDALRSITMLFGALDGPARGEVLSYEGPFGVGYAVALLKPAEGETDPLVRLAKRGIENYVKYGKRVPPPETPEGDLGKRAGTFVSIKKRGELRGCIGTILPTLPTVAQEIVANAVKAAVADPRFPPVRVEELPELEVSVDVLSPLEPVGNQGDLDPRVYGVLVRKGGRSGVLLPDLPGVGTVEEQLGIARRKAGIEPWEKDVEIHRFTVERHA